MIDTKVQDIRLQSHASKEIQYKEKNKQKRPSTKNMRPLSATIHLAKKMGTLLGGCQILLEAMLWQLAFS